jgi:DnaJ family protein C protein 11
MDDDSEEKEEMVLQLDPYAILNVDRDASEAMIQSSYKNLSRTFHPDKHPPGKSREAAQEVFVSFKNAHEILTDPVLKLVYDEHGLEGIRAVKLTIHSPDADALYPTLQKYHRMNQVKRAKDHMRTAMESARIDRADHAVQIRTVMEFPCSLQSTAFLGEGSEPIDIPESTGASISVSATAASASKWSTTVSASSDVTNGKGRGAGSVSVGYKPQQGTSISTGIDLTNPMRLSVGTSRSLANRTIVNVTARTMPNSNKLSLSFVTHRDLWDRQFQGTWALGLGSDLSMHYALLSLTTLWSDVPRCTLKFNVGVNEFPFKISAKQDFDHGLRTGFASFEWGPTGVEWKAILSRTLTSYAQWSMGIKHATSSGLTWLIQMERGDFTFRLPISISSIMSPGYMYKTMYLSLLSLLVDEAIGDIIHDSYQDLLTSDEGDQNLNYSADLDSQKTKADAEQQAKLMKSVAMQNMEREESARGLVIYQAQYFVNSGPCVDVTVQLQFFVRNSSLQLPAGSKSRLLGIYNITPTSPSSVSWWRRSWWSTNTTSTTMSDATVPQLRLRFAYGDGTYEQTIRDFDPLTLPNEKAIRLGKRDMVR